MRSLLRRFGTATRPLSLKDLKAEPLLDFVVTSDFYRVDVGLIITRRPIFFDLEDPEVEFIRRTHQLKVKYDLYKPFPKEFGKFDREDIEDPMTTVDDQATHFKRNPDESVIQFRPRSKNWKYCRPDVLDPHKVTTHGLYNVFFLVKKNGQWMFPQVPATHQATFNRTKESIFNDLSQDQFTVMYTSKYPMCVQRAAIPSPELDANPYLRKCLGRKILFFPALHDVGHMTSIHGFEDWAWVPKPLLNKYLSREDFEALIPHIKLVRD